MSSSLLDAIVRDGARQMLAAALAAEVATYIEAHSGEAEVLPLMYLHGLSTSDFARALEQFLGTSPGCRRPRSPG